MKSLRIGIDFDRVLFDTDRFKEELSEAIEGFQEGYEEAKEGYTYSHVRHAEISDKDLERFDEILEKSEEFLFEDIDVLESLDHEIVLITRGEPDHQIEKIKHSGIHKLVEETHIINGPPEKKPKDFLDLDLLVDDQKYEIEEVETETFHFDRSENSLKDVLEKVRDLEQVE